MPDFSDIALEYERIKDAPEVIDDLRTSDAHKETGIAADDTQLRQEVLPDAETHYKLQEKYARMFDKSTRAGAKSKLHGLILPGGRKNFSDFHDNFTGTGRYQPRKTPEKVQFPDQGPKIDPYPDKVILYERCPQCKERVDQQNFIPQMNFVPTPEALEAIQDEEKKKEELEWITKWGAAQVRAGSIVCYLFCVDCPKKIAEEVKKIRHDPFAAALTVAVDENGRPITLADIRAREYLEKVKSETRELVFAMVKNERNNPDSQAFYGANKLD